jgi:TolB-like protein/DNA-binding winged helix-turn-helix (wHTH) protein
MTLPEPTRLAFDDVVIDFAGRRLLRAGAEQALEPKAFGVLALLAQAPGRVFARDEILDAVWGHRHVTPGVLNRVMTLLRHALGEDAQGARYLHTVHGVGYRFDLPGPVPGIPMQSTHEPETSPVPTRAPLRRADDRPRAFPRIVLWSLPLLALLAFAGWKWWPLMASAPTVVAAAAPVADRSIAVLPMANASHDPDQQFFSDGLSDNLIDALSRFDGLRVIGRMSSFQFRNGEDDARAVGAKLGVAYLVDGRVQHVGDVVRINARLTRVADGSTLWAEHYDRPYKDLFALQDEIARAIATALHAKLLPAQAASKQDKRPPSGNIEAYNAYLQGSKHWHDLDFPKAAEDMARAVQLDPGYAVAWADLSGALSTVATFGNVPAEAAREQLHSARLAADKALQLAPELGSAHAARAYLAHYAFDYRTALSECRRAVQLAPDDAMVLNGCGFVLDGIGKLGEAIRLRERLLSIEPLFSVNVFQYANLLVSTGRLDEAEKFLRTAEEMERPRPLVHMNIAVLRGDAGAALAIAKRVPRERPWAMALATQVGPDRAAADRRLAELLADQEWIGRNDFGDNRYALAQIYALRGDSDQALEWLARSRAMHSPHMLFILADPFIMRFRDDPRFVAFCKTLGLPPPDTSNALSIDQIRALPAAKR